MAENNADDRRIPKTLGAFLRFVLAEIVRQRRWLLVPLWIVLVAMAVLFVLSGNSYLLPAIYLAF